MAKPHIADSEWAVMEALWESSPRTASDVTLSLHSTTNWAENTVRTLLTRLVDKGAVKTGENQAGTRTFRPAVTRKACVKVESESFLRRVFRGSAKPLLLHFAENNELSPDEVAELKRLLDKSLDSRS